jgi:hypothetical protein
MTTLVVFIGVALLMFFVLIFLAVLFSWPME